MNIPDTSIAVELAKHALALHLLARLLVAAQDAEDLVQDIALHTLRVRPRNPAGLLAFLKTKLRRFASNRRRSQVRRTKREAAAGTFAEREAPSPYAVVEQQEQLRRVFDQLSKLPQPYHDVLFRRFFHDETPSAIATQLGAPLATVKSQLKRGLAMLRRRLDKQDRHDWRAVLCASLGLDRNDVRAAGAGSMPAVALCLAAALCCVLWTTSLTSSDHATSPAVSGAVENAGVVALEPGRDPTTSTRTDASPSTPSEPANRRRLAGRCVDERGLPISGATVELSARAAADELFHWEHDNPPPPLAPVRQISGADGRFEFVIDALPIIRHQVDCAHPGRVAMHSFWHQLADESYGEIGDIVLPIGTVVTGRLVDSAGLPQADQYIELLLEWLNDERILPWTRRFQTTTRVDGTFELPSRLPPGRYEVVLTERRLASPRVIEIGAVASAKHVEVIVDAIVAPMAATGIVVDDAGNPISGAWLVLEDGGTSTGSDGRFRLARPARSPDVVPVLVTCLGYDSRLVDGIEWGRNDLRIALKCGCPFEIRVRDASTGLAVENVRVEVKAVASRDANRFECNGPFHNGIVRLPPLGRGRYVMSAVERGMPARRSQREVSIDDNNNRTMEIGLPRLPSPLPATAEARVTVRTEAGLTVAGSAVEVLVRKPTPKSLSEWATHTRALTSDVGVATVAVPAGMPVRLIVTGASHLRAEVEHMALSSTGTVVTVNSGARVRGRVTPASLLASYRAAPATRNVAALHLRGTLRGSELGAFEPEASHILRGEIRADGTFDLGRWPAGEWQLDLIWTLGVAGAEQRDCLGVVADSVTTVDGEDAEIELDLHRFVACNVHGTVHWNGQPLALRDVRLTYQAEDGSGDDWQLDTRTDANGRMLLSVAPGRARLEWWAVGAEPTLLYSDNIIDLPSGSGVSPTFQLRSGSVRLRLRWPDGSPARGILPQVTSDTVADYLPNKLRTNEHGLLDLILPIGTYMMSLATAGATKHLGTVSVVAGETVESDFVIPSPR